MVEWWRGLRPFQNPKRISLTLSLGFFFLHIFILETVNFIDVAFFCVAQEQRNILHIPQGAIASHTLSLSLSFPSIFLIYVYVSSHKFGKFSGYKSFLTPQNITLLF